jgi:dihydropteroate synthase
MTPLPLNPDRIVIMGVLNVTPDSFSDGGRYTDLDRAVAHAMQMRSEGADIVDVGGESTRPGARPVDADEELHRVLPVLRELVAAGVPTSIDTYRSSVAAAALEVGAHIVNDVSGGLGDPAMADVVRDTGCPWILMHSRGTSATMQQFATYDDVVADVRRELLDRVDAAVAAGVPQSMLAIDPGLGFAKTGAHNWTLLHALTEFVGMGLPVLIASSRKSFLGKLLADADGAPRPVDDREDATTALTAYCALQGVWGVRSHAARASVDAALAIRAVQRG